MLSWLTFWGPFLLGMAAGVLVCTIVTWVVMK